MSANQYHSNNYMKLDKVRSALAAIISQGQEETARERSVRLMPVITSSPKAKPNWGNNF